MGRAEEAESTLSQFRSRERVFASASARAEKSTDVQESEVVVKKTINKVSVVGAATSSSAFSSSQESSSALFIFILDLTLPSSRLGPWHTEGWQRATDTPTDTVTPRGGRKGRDDDIPTPEAA